MALNVGTLVAYLELDRKGFDKDLGNVEKDATRRSKLVGAASTAAATAATAGIAIAAAGAVKFLSGTKDAASDLQQTVSKTQVVFGQNAAQVLKWAENSDKAFGLSKQAALAAAASFGDMFQQLGFTGAEATKNSQAIVQMAADLGSFHDVDPSDVLDRISAAMRGEYDSLQALIPNINAARIEQEAMAMTGKTVAKELTAQEKATATLAIIQKDGARAAGDFARTSGDAANQQRILSAQITNGQAAIGDKLLPAYASLLGFITGTVIPGLSDVSGWVSDNSDVLGTLAKVIGAVLVPALVVWGTTSTVQAAKAAAAWLLAQASAAKSAAVQVAAAASTVASWVVLGAQSLAQAARVAAAWVIAMGPVGWVIATVVALVALIIANWDTIKRVTGVVWDWVMGKLGAVWDWIKRTVADTLVNILATIVGKWNEAKDWTVRTWDSIRDAISNAWSRIKDTVNLTVLWIVEKMAWWAERVIGAADAAFGWVPGLGDKLEGAKRAVQSFRERTNAEMDAIRNKEIGVKVNVAGHYGIDVAKASAAIGFFAEGGWTGPGGKYQPAGVVHADEFVVKKDARRSIERRAPGLLDHMNRTGELPGYAGGGLVLGGFNEAPPEIGRHARDGANRTTNTAIAAFAKQMAGMMKAAAESAGGTGIPGRGGLGPTARAAADYTTRNYGVTNIGGYANRNIAGTNKKSKHAYGLAIDIMTRNKALGDRIAADFAHGTAKRLFNTQNTIWWRKISSRGGAWRRYGGVHPHTDHVHADFDRGGLARGLGWLPKATLSPERVLSPEQTRAFERLVEVLDRGALSAVQSQPAPVERHLHYHAAAGRSLAEDDFFDAAGRARMLTLGW